MSRILAVLLVVSGVSWADPPSEDAGKKDLAMMQGDWNMVSMVRDGKPIPDADVRATSRTVQGNQYRVLRSGNVIGKGTFKIDATKKPKTIDFSPESADNDQVMLGIYEFDGDNFKLCYAPGGKDRPTAFSSKDGEGQTLSVYRRVKK